MVTVNLRGVPEVVVEVGKDLIQMLIEEAEKRGQA